MQPSASSAVGISGAAIDRIVVQPKIIAAARILASLCRLPSQVTKTPPRVMPSSIATSSIGAITLPIWVSFQP